MSLVEKKSRQIKQLSIFLSLKSNHLERNMLLGMACHGCGCCHLLTLMLVYSPFLVQNRTDVMTVGFLAIAVAMVLAGLAAIWTGADPSTLSYGQTLMIVGSVLVSGGAVVAALALALRQLAAIRATLSRASGEEPATPATTMGSTVEEEPALPASAAPDAPPPPVFSPPPAPPPPFEPATPPPASPPPMQAQGELPPPPPRRVPGYLASAASGALGGVAAASLFGRKEKGEEPVPGSTRDVAAAPQQQKDDLEAMLVEVLGTPSRKPFIPPEPEPLELDIPVLPLHVPGKEEEPVEPAAEPLDLTAAPDEPRPSPEAPAMQEPEPEPEGPSLLREGVIASIPFKLYSDGSIVAEISGEDRRFKTLKDFRDFVGG